MKASLYSLEVFECRVEFFSRCPYALSRVSPSRFALHLSRIVVDTVQLVREKLSWYFDLGCAESTYRRHNALS